MKAGAPFCVNVGAGNPVAVAVKVPGALVAKVTLFPLVIAGGWFTVSVKVCTAFGKVPLLAEIIMV